MLMKSVRNIPFPWYRRYLVQIRLLGGFAHLFISLLQTVFTGPASMAGTHTGVTLPTPRFRPRAGKALTDHRQ
jgi:hypothetical protein